MSATEILILFEYELQVRHFTWTGISSISVSFEKGITYTNSNKIKWGNSLNVEPITLGEYQSEDSAKVVLEQILQSFANKRYVFEMPQSDEI